MLSENKTEYVKKTPRKITPQRLRNIALYYLKRFETSEANLRAVLKRRIDDYARFNKEFCRNEAYSWLDELIRDFAERHYVDDTRFADIKIRGYLAAGKSPRYILNKMREKGIDDSITEKILSEQEVNPLEAALKLAKKKKIGIYNPDANQRKERRNKDLGILIRAGFDYDIALKVLESDDADF